MMETGVDISHQKSKKASNFSGQGFDFVITLCTGEAEDFCPVFRGNACTGFFPIKYQSGETNIRGWNSSGW